MNFKKGDPVYLVIDGKMYTETASRDFWHADFKLFKSKDDALCNLINDSRDTSGLVSCRRHKRGVK